MNNYKGAKLRKNPEMGTLFRYLFLFYSLFPCLRGERCVTLPTKQTEWACTYGVHIHTHDMTGLVLKAFILYH